MESPPLPPASLVATAGPLSGQTFALAAPGELTIGRDSSNSVAVPNPAVSRIHCKLVRDEDGKVTVQDLESRNGTFVNERPVREQPVKDGDEIRVGVARFLLLMQARTVQRPSVILDSRAWNDTGSQCLSQEESIQFLLGDPDDAAQRPAERGLRTLIRLASAVQAERTTAGLAQQVLAACLESLPADQAALLPDECDIEEAFTRDLVDGPGATVSIHADIVKRVRSSKMALVSAPGLAAMAAPVMRKQGAPGVIYVTAADPRQRFTAEHLQLLAAAASLIAPAIERAHDWEQLEAERQRLADAMHMDMVGDGPRIREVYRFVERVAPVDSTVLILGESGTGKELVARAIHCNGSRAARPFIAINCAALAENLLESEMFGHERGAFTGAVAQKKGKMELADGGTLFLDEVGEMPLALQAKLLRALQERTIERVGGSRPVSVDVRILAATNRDLRNSAVFRPDLYFRLNVLTISMPPLRERKEDIPLLAAHFVDKHARRIKKPIAGLSSRARACLLAYSWPGNVRELENAIERAVVMGGSDQVQPEDLPPEVTETAGVVEEAELGNFHTAVRRAKEQLILAAVDQARGNMVEAAKLLGLHPNYLHRLTTNMGLRNSIRG